MKMYSFPQLLLQVQTANCIINRIRVIWRLTIHVSDDTQEQAKSQSSEIIYIPTD